MNNLEVIVDEEWNVHNELFKEHESLTVGGNTEHAEEHVSPNVGGNIEYAEKKLMRNMLQVMIVMKNVNFNVLKNMRRLTRLRYYPVSPM